MAKVIIVDDHPIAIMALKFLIEKEGHVVVAETGDGLEALKLVEKHNPDIIIIDIDIHSLEGIEVVRRLRDKSFTGNVIIISAKNTDYYAAQALRYGANGFVSKKNNFQEVITAINVTQNGIGYFPLKGVSAAADKDSSNDSMLVDTLSPQELQVFKLLVAGMDNMSIARMMNISNKTVSTYKTRTLEKLRCKNLHEMLNFAHRNKMD